MAGALINDPQCCWPGRVKHKWTAPYDHNQPHQSDNGQGQIMTEPVTNCPGTCLDIQKDTLPNYCPGYRDSIQFSQSEVVSMLSMARRWWRWWEINWIKAVGVLATKMPRASRSALWGIYICVTYLIRSVIKWRITLLLKENGRNELRLWYSLLERY